jgi:hypothetical protein
LLLKEHARSGRINLTAFWGARARRLFPALAVMLVVVALVAASMPALEQQTVFTQGIATLAYVNNWLLIARTPLFPVVANPITAVAHLVAGWNILPGVPAVGLGAGARAATKPCVDCGGDDGVGADLCGVGLVPRQHRRLD